MSVLQELRKVCWGFFKDKIHDTVAPRAFGPLFWLRPYIPKKLIRSSQTFCCERSSLNWFYLVLHRREKQAAAASLATVITSRGRCGDSIWLRSPPKGLQRQPSLPGAQSPWHHSFPKRHSRRRSSPPNPHPNPPPGSQRSPYRSSSGWWRVCPRRGRRAGRPAPCPAPPAAVSTPPAGRCTSPRSGPAGTAARPAAAGWRRRPSPCSALRDNGQPSPPAPTSPAPPPPKKPVNPPPLPLLSTQRARCPGNGLAPPLTAGVHGARRRELPARENAAPPPGPTRRSRARPEAALIDPAPEVGRGATHRGWEGGGGGERESARFGAGREADGAPRGTR